jgi:hypothetical protein
MFKLQPNPTFKMEVKIPVHGADPQPITIVVNHMSMPDFEAHMKSEKTKAMTDLQFIGEIVKDWEGVDVAYSRDALAMLLDNYASAGRRIIERYVEEVTQAGIKN